MSGRPQESVYPHGEEERAWALGLAALALFLAILALVEPSEPVWFDVLVLALPAIAFASRSLTPRFPTWGIYVAGLTAALGVNLPELGSEGALFLPILAVGHVSFFEDRRHVAHICGALAIATPAVIRLSTTADDWGWQFWVLGGLFAVGTGEMGYRYRASLIELQETRALVASQALLDERRRIARDVHDLVGHSLAVVMLQVTAARELLRRDPDEAEAALDDAARVGRESLTEVRRTLGLLRDGESDGVVPSPVLADVVLLVDEYRMAGLEVACTIEGDPERLERTCSIAGYRIVQEALANASKHAALGQACVAIDIGDEDLAIAIRNTISNSHRVASGGYGLVGMRERATSVGGTLKVGPQGGHWVVEAALPRVHG